MPLSGRRLLAAALLVSALPAATLAEEGPIAATAGTVRDFMVQNVCLDEAGAVRIGRSPIDQGGCAGQRDLLPGEALPYHKHDHASPQDRRTAPSGYQRHDSFPVLTQGLGTVVEQSFDFGDGARRFGAFDRGSDGGDIAIVSPGAVSIGATETGGGFNLWVGECHGAIEPDALAR